MFRANLAYLRVPRRRAVVKAEIEERSFVANYAPLDDGQVRFGVRTRRLGEENRLAEEAKTLSRRFAPSGWAGAAGGARMGKKVF